MSTTGPSEERVQCIAQIHGHLERLRRLRGPGPAAAQPASMKARQRLKAWQAARLAAAYDDLLQSSRWGPAARFFLQDLYGAKDLHQRDEDVTRVVPKMERLLPRSALQTLEQALRMDALSESLDADLTARLLDQGRLQADGDLDEAAYSQSYRASMQQVSNRQQRIEQIELVERIGRSLDHLTRLPMLATSLRLMKKPAELAGLGELHGFLHRGFSAFSHMKGADEFLRRIVQGEQEQMQRWMAG